MIVPRLSALSSIRYVAFTFVRRSVHGSHSRPTYSSSSSLSCCSRAHRTTLRSSLRGSAPPGPPSSSPSSPCCSVSTAGPRRSRPPARWWMPSDTSATGATRWVRGAGATQHTECSHCWMSDKKKITDPEYMSHWKIRLERIIVISRVNLFCCARRSARSQLARGRGRPPTGQGHATGRAAS